MSKHGGEGFNVDPAGRLVVYADGACSRQGQAGASAGVGVWFGKDHPSNVSQRAPGSQTSQNAEIQAAVKAVEIAKQEGFRDVRIKSDSEFVVRGMQDSGTRGELQQLKSACKDINVKFERVPGHEGHGGNEGADALAKKGAGM